MNCAASITARPGTMLRDIFSDWSTGLLPEIVVTGLSVDSRLVNPGDLFLATQGVAGHGLEHVAEAVERGAVAIAWESALNLQSPPIVSVPLIEIPRLGSLIGDIASCFYGNPSEQLQVIGITGTNGKTSVAQFIAQAVSSDERPCGLIGTLGVGVFGRTRRSSNTTPGALDNQRILAEIRAANADYAVMEVSSHALDQGRINGVNFSTAVFTNLSHDHLDYHGSMESYAAAKKKLFVRSSLKHLVLNIDDEIGRAWAQEFADHSGLLTCSVAVGNPYGADLCVDAIEVHSEGVGFRLLTPWGKAKIQTKVLGGFNVENLLAAGAVLGAHGFDLEMIERSLSETTPVPGRMEMFRAPGQPTIVVDYAHTPDALEQALMTLRHHISGKLICVFGCGGDRDVDKRPVMGAVAERYADLAIITDDNPRHEQPANIAQDIQLGLKNAERMPVIHDRSEAIRAAFELAQAEDCVLVAGKGHEDYQIIGDERFSFSDRGQVQTLLAGRKP